VRALDLLTTVLIPPLCACCGRSCLPEAIVCSSCHRRLAAAPPLIGPRGAGLDLAWASAPHEGVARDLVTALKLRRLLPVAELMANRIHWLARSDLLSGTLVPVPTARLRSMGRGFDPAAEIAAALARRADLPVVACLSRAGIARQVGRRRSQRLGSPPRIRVVGEAPRSALLVDDVSTTGATLTACAGALRRAGAVRVVAVTFSRRL
jgi:predicted amidophosphoribosyltransferase